MHLDTERDLYQKITLILIAAMAVVFAVWTAVNRANEGVLFRETLLEVSQQGSTTVYSGRVYGTNVTITSREEKGTKFVNISVDGEYYAECRVEYPEGTIKTEYGDEVGRIKIIRNDEVLFSGGYDPNPEVNPYANYFNEDGTWDMGVMVGVQGYSSSNPWIGFEFDAMDIMRFANGPALSVRGSWIMYFAMLVASIFVALETAFPNVLFYFSHFLYVRDPEPTELYYLCHKIGSVLAVIVLFILYMKGVFALDMP